MINYQHSPSLCCRILQWDNSNQIETMCYVELTKITKGLLFKQNKYQALTEMKLRTKSHTQQRKTVCSFGEEKTTKMVVLFEYCVNIIVVKKKKNTP